MTDNSNDKLEQNIKRALQQSVDGIDAATLSQIRQLRARAVEKTQELNQINPVNWFGVLSGAVATVTVTLFVLLILFKNEPVLQSLPAEDIELISSVDDLEVYEDFEFYLWLAEHET